MTVNNCNKINFKEKTELLKSLGYKIDKPGKITLQIMLHIKKNVK